jgi:ectoine hydroxylase-related dioxygenase (phytanoyl-CoA dioxygenase family)
LTLENGPFALAVGTHELNIGWEYFADAEDKRAAAAAMGWNKDAKFNTGPAGSTAVYSGKTWHAGTVNASDVVRKGLNINFVPKHPLDTNRRNHFDVCGLDRERYDRLAQLIGVPDYLIEHQADFVETPKSKM